MRRKEKSNEKENDVWCFVFALIDADSIRKEYDEASAKLTKIESKLSSLKQKLKQDFGIEIHVLVFINILL